jgi:hypothetical protein
MDHGARYRRVVKLASAALDHLNARAPTSIAERSNGRCFEKSFSSRFHKKIIAGHFFIKIILIK